MNGSFDPMQEDVVWVGDTGLFVAFGRQQNNKYTALERFARGNDITFVIPKRVYDELGGAPDRSTPGQTPINSAIDAGWVTVADEPDYTNSTVSQVMTISPVAVVARLQWSWRDLPGQFAFLTFYDLIRYELGTELARRWEIEMNGMGVTDAYASAVVCRLACCLELATRQHPSFQTIVKAVRVAITGSANSEPFYPSATEPRLT